MAALEGQKIIVSGGGSGIGLATARSLIAAGAQICITGRNADRLRTAQEQLAGNGASVEMRAFDVSDRAAAFDVVAELHEAWDRVDGLVNNAGIYKTGKFLDFKPEDFESLFQINLMGCVHLMQAVLPHMIAQKSGRIVNIASTAGKWGSVGQSAYNISKHAVVGLTRCVALEMAAQGVTVNAICPGLVATDMMNDLLSGQAQIAGTSEDALKAAIAARIPIQRPINPEEIGELTAYLLSPAAAGMTGQSIVYDGGMLMI